MFFNKDYKSVYITVIFLSLFFLFFYFLDFILESDLFISMFEKKWFDYKITYNGLTSFLSYSPKKASKNIIIAGIDEETISSYGWPFKRRYYAKLVENLNRYGASVIAFDIVFMDPDRSDLESDRVFADTIKNYDNVILALPIDSNLNLKLPIKSLQFSTKYFGSVYSSHIIDYDGNIRKVYPFINRIQLGEEEKKYSYGDVCPHCDADMKNIGIPLLGVMAYVRYTNANIVELYRVWKDKKFYLNFRFSKAMEDLKSLTTMFDYISIKKIIEDKLSSEEKKRIKGSIVFVGSVAQGAYDHYSTPVSPHTPGVEIHALCADNLLNDDYLRDLPLYWQIFLLLFFIWLPVLVIKNSVTKIFFINFTLVLLLMFFSVLMIKYHYNHYFIAFAFPNFVSFVYVVAYKSVVEDRQKRWIKNTFSQYLSPEIVDMIVKDPSRLKLGGEKRDITVLFMDIAGFTSISEMMTPEEVTNLLNFYLSSLSDIILEEKGVIDKYIGDCIMAFWNAPLDIDKPSIRAVRSAMKCINKVEELNRIRDLDSIRMRIGIHAGKAVVGNMGSNKRFAYSVLGDTVNLASRLEGANKFFGTSVMVSHQVYEEAKDDFVFKYIGKIIVPGKRGFVEVYEPYKEKKDMSLKDDDFINNYQNAIKYFYEENYADAIEYFKKALELFPNDAITNFYLRFSEMILKGEEKFDGIFCIRSK